MGSKSVNAIRERLSITPTPLTSEHYSITIHSDPADIESEWRALERIGIGTAFQSFGWASAWCRTAAGKIGEEPVLVLGCDVDGSPAFLLPLAVVRSVGFTFVTWLAQSHSAYNMGLFRKDGVEKLSARELNGIIGLLQKVHPDIDGLRLTGQPKSWDGIENPLSRLSCLSRAECYEMPVGSELDAVLNRQLSRSVRQELSRKCRRLCDDAVTATMLATATAERTRIVDAYIDQKSMQIDANGLPDLIGGAVHRFYYELAKGPFADQNMVHAGLMADGEIVSTLTGIHYKGRFYHLNGSVAETPLRRWSPGQLLVRDLIGRAALSGVTTWDFGPGMGSHKESWRPAPIEMFDTNIALSVAGRSVITLSQTYRGLREIVVSRPRLRANIRAARSAALTAWRRIKALVAAPGLHVFFPTIAGL